MKIRAWHEKRLEERPEYARAHEDISLAQWVADYVVDQRVAAGLTQAQLADLAGTTQATVSLIENGEGNPRLDTLAKLMGVFEAVPEDFGNALARAVVGGAVRTTDVFAMFKQTGVIIKETELTASPTDDAEPVSGGAWQDSSYADVSLVAAA